MLPNRYGELCELQHRAASALSAAQLDAGDVHYAEALSDLIEAGRIARTVCGAVLLFAVRHGHDDEAALLRKASEALSELFDALHAEMGVNLQVKRPDAIASSRMVQSG